MIRTTALCLQVAALAALMLLAPQPEAAAQEAAEAKQARRFTRVPAPDGIQIRRYNKTEGAKPGKKDRVIVHYHGTLENGKVFDSSVDRGTPAVFRLNKVVPCWTAAMTRLRVGEKAQIVCPPDTAYGVKGAPPNVPPNARLTFEIELIGIQ